MTMYLRNIWYVAAYSDELQRAPIARTLLDEPLVLYRKEDGTPVVLSDRCPHRFAPLSRGRIVGDLIECGYHGLRFDSSGACVATPHGNAVPAAARVRNYPAIERYGFVWFWPGDPQGAEAVRPPDLDYLSQPERLAVVKGYLRVKANYQLVVDNLLDLSHAQFLHPGFAISGVTPQQALASTTTKLMRETDRITAMRVRKGLPPNGPTRSLFGFGPEPVDSRSHMTWFPPSLLSFDLGSCLSGSAPEEGLCLPAAHCITPETEFTCHYFFAQARNLRRDDAHVGEQLLAMLDTAFRTQDEPMIEDVQRRMGETSNLDALNPILLQTDAAPVAARRFLQKLIDAEQSAYGRTTEHARTSATEPVGAAAD
jgi:phenylpropionate dioxygenase-like ring-hydroxylating dioxygenase large terminal subunit